MEFLLWMLVVLVVYIVAIFVVVSRTDKLGARSGLFGSGLVTMFMGFILHKIMEYSASYGYWDIGYGEFPLLYYILTFGFLIAGLSGIAMVAIDLLKAVSDLEQVALEAAQKKEQPKQQEQIPAWKRVEMGQES